MSTDVSTAVSTAAPSSAGNPELTGKLLFIGTSGVHFTDISDATPTLQAFSQKAAIGQLAVRSVFSVTCPTDGWLTLSAMSRAADSRISDGRVRYCRAPLALLPTQGDMSAMPDWPAWATTAERSSYQSQVGLLGQTLFDAGVSTAAVGSTAAIAAADREGVLSHFYPVQFTSPKASAVDNEVLTRSTREALIQADVVFVDLGSVQELRSLSRAEQVSTIDARLAAVLAGAQAADTTMLASVGDSHSSKAALQFVGITGLTRLAAGANAKEFGASNLYTSSTRHNGLIQLTDLPTGILTILGLEDRRTGSMVGSSITQVNQNLSLADRQQVVLDHDLKIRLVRPIIPWFWNVIILSQLLLYLVTTLVLKWGRERSTRQRHLSLMRHGAVLYAAVIPATFLAGITPWWRSEHPNIWLWFSICAWAVAITAVTFLPAMNRSLLGPMGWVSFVLAAVITADMATGSNLMISTIMGYQAVVGGRFYGLGNPGYALLATSYLLTVVAVGDWLIRKGRTAWAAALVATTGILLVVVDGSPNLGADFGGVPPTVLAFVSLTLLVAGIRISVIRGLLIVVAAAAVVMTIAVLDWMRPADAQTHLGRFVQTILDGGAWNVIQRKFQANMSILFKPLSIVIPFASAFLALVLARPAAWGVGPLALAYRRSTALRYGLVAWGILAFAGFALNDSGTVIPVTSATIAIPLLIAVSTRALEDEESGSGVNTSIEPDPTAAI